jgi:Zn-dependent protease
MSITIFSLIVLVLSVIIHEVAHGWVAYSLGDITAKGAGRLTLNPLKHLDPLGSILIPLFLVLSGSPFVVGWAKPVPINPYNFRDQKWGELKVSLAGPASNFLVALIFGLLLRVPQIPASFIDFFAIISIYNLILAIFNLIPIPPLDGSWILFSFIPDKYANFKNFFGQYGIFFLIFLLFFSGLSWVFTLASYIFELLSGFSF